MFAVMLPLPEENMCKLCLKDARTHLPLPQGWEKRFDKGGRAYYVDHTSKTTHWEDPRTGESENLFKDFAYVMRRSSLETWEERHLKENIDRFRSRCLEKRGVGTTTIVVSRKSIFEDSFQEIMRITSQELHQNLMVRFKEDAEGENGGQIREWFYLLSQEIFNPMHDLFTYADNSCVQINPASIINPNHLEYFQYAGRFIAMALFHGQLIHSSFTIPLFKKMLRKKPILEDFKKVDKKFYNSVLWIRNNNVDNFELHFVAEFELFGDIESHELKEGGKSILVNESNKEEFIELLVEWRSNRGIEKQMKAFLRGFETPLPIYYIFRFEVTDLEPLLCGKKEINVNDWQKNTVYKTYTAGSKQPVWAWIRSVDNEKRARLLLFVTGSDRIPIGGFAELRGSMEPRRFCIERAGNDYELPKSNTSLNQLCLPPYRSYEELVEKFRNVIEKSEQFSA